MPDNKTPSTLSYVPQTIPEEFCSAAGNRGEEDRVLEGLYSDCNCVYVGGIGHILMNFPRRISSRTGLTPLYIIASSNFFSDLCWSCSSAGLGPGSLGIRDPVFPQVLTAASWKNPQDLLFGRSYHFSNINFRSGLKSTTAPPFKEEGPIYSDWFIVCYAKNIPLNNEVRTTFYHLALALSFSLDVGSSTPSSRWVTASPSAPHPAVPVAGVLSLGFLYSRG